MANKNKDNNIAQSAWEAVKDGAEAVSDVAKQATESTVDATKNIANKVTK
jgi:hypothetical protein